MRLGLLLPLVVAASYDLGDERCEFTEPRPDLERGPVLTGADLAAAWDACEPPPKTASQVRREERAAKNRRGRGRDKQRQPW